MVVILYFRWNKRAATVSPPSPFWKEDEEIMWEQVLKRATVMCQYFWIENQFEIERASAYFSIENQFEIKRASAYFWNFGISALAPSPKRIIICRYTFGIYTTSRSVLRTTFCSFHLQCQRHCSSEILLKNVLLSFIFCHFFLFFSLWLSYHTSQYLIITKPSHIPYYEDFLFYSTILSCLEAEKSVEFNFSMLILKISQPAETAVIRDSGSCKSLYLSVLWVWYSNFKI